MEVEGASLAPDIEWKGRRRKCSQLRTNSVCFLTVVSLAGSHSLVPGLKGISFRLICYLLCFFLCVFWIHLPFVSC